MGKADLEDVLIEEAMAISEKELRVQRSLLLWLTYSSLTPQSIL